MAMEALIDLSRGPLFRFAFVLAALGLARLVLLSAWGLRQARRRAGHGPPALGQAVARTVRMLNPARHLGGDRRAYSALSMLFHAGVTVVPALCAGHVRLWRRGLGIAWPALPLPLADALTLVTVAAAMLLVVARARHPAARAVSRFQDWCLPPLIVLSFLSGYLLAHPVDNPFSLRAVLLAHVGAGDLLLVLTPFTKIAHCVLLPFSQLVNEMAWRLVPGAGHEVTRTLGKEGQPT